MADGRGDRGLCGRHVVSKESGEGLRSVLGIVPGNPVGDLISQHERLAEQLVWITMVMAVVGVLSALFVSRGRERKGANLVLPALLVIVALVATIWVVRVGDLGSRALWNPTGEMVYTSAPG